MTLPSEPIGSIPRPKELQDAMQEAAAGRISDSELDVLVDAAVRDTLRRFEETGSPVVTDGEQRKPSFATYPIAGQDGVSSGRPNAGSKPTLKAPACAATRTPRRQRVSGSALVQLPISPEGSGVALAGWLGGRASSSRE